MKNNFFLIDMDNFYSSCEVVEQKIDDHMPIIVGGNYTRSVVSSCNKVAKDLGIKAGMPIFQAKKIIPSIILLPINFNLYEKMSQKIEKILLEYTKTVQKTSIDEWFLDFSKNDKYLDELEVAEFIKSKIFKTLGLKCSIGIGANFFNAKTASYYAKPFGIFVIDESNFKTFVWRIPINEMYMIGEKRCKQLKDININTIGELANFKDQKTLHSLFGKSLQTILANANNINLKETITKKHSVSSGQTFLEDKADYDDILSFLKIHFRTIQRKIIVNSQLTKTVSVALKTSHGERRRQATLKIYTDKEDIIWTKLIELFDEIWSNKPLRAITVSFDNVIDHFKYEYNQDLFSNPKRLSTVDKVNRELGYKAVKYAKVTKK